MFLPGPVIFGNKKVSYQGWELDRNHFRLQFDKILPQNAGIGSPGGYHQGIARPDAVAEIRGV